MITKGTWLIVKFLCNGSVDMPSPQNSPRSWDTDTPANGHTAVDIKWEVTVKYQNHNSAEGTEQDIKYYLDIEYMC